MFSAALAESDPEIAEAIALELGRQRDEIELIASENYRQPRRARSAGLGADQQIRRRPAGQALLRRLPVRRHRRAARHRAGDATVRLRLRQCAAAFRRVGQCRSVHGADAAGRHLHGAQPRRRRPSHPRLAGQPVRQMVQGGALRRAPRRPSHRHGRGRAARQGASAQGDHRRRLGLSAHHRFPPLPRDRRRGRRLSDGRHGAFRRPRRRRRASEPVPARPCRDHDHAQDAARPARRHHPHQRRGTGEEDQFGGVPRHAGRPADARHRRQGGGVRRGAAAVVQALREERRGERQGAGRNAEGPRPRYRLRRHRHASHAGRSAQEAPDRQGGRGRARPRPHHLQQERHSVRSGKAHRHVGRAARHAGRHDARLRHRRVPPDRRADRRSARCAVAKGRRARMRRRKPACATRSGVWSAGSRSTRGKGCAVRVVQASIPR